MFAISAPTLAALKLGLVFLLLIILLRMHVRLWLTIFAGTLCVAVVCGLSPMSWPDILMGVLTDESFLLLCVMVYLIMLLSGVQEATGQSHDLVVGLERYIQNPRIRLIIFPALVGLLPMPGGALFSCPMIKDAAHDMGISDEKKGLINYWFRHIWELAWPLYPGYALTCSLLDIPMTRLWQLTFPIVLMNFCVGWFFYMRDLAHLSPSHSSASADDAVSQETTHAHSLGKVLLNLLPIAVTLLGAVFFGVLFSLFLPQAPGQAAFALSLLAAISTAMYQGRGRFSRPMRSMLFEPNVRRILLLLLTIFLFKNTLGASGILPLLGSLGQSTAMLIPALLIIPILAGLLTGIMVAYVGIAFPIILGLIEHSPLQAYLTPVIILALAAGNAGQMLSPLHVCLVVTCEYFTTNVPQLWRKLVTPICVLMLGTALWAGFLALTGTRF